MESMENMERVKGKIKEIKENIRKWSDCPFVKRREIEVWDIHTIEEFKAAMKKLVEVQMGKIEGFHGETGEIEGISYGLVKVKKPQRIGWPLEIGLMAIFEPGEIKTEGRVGALGFGVDPYSKEIVGISFFDNSPAFILWQLKGQGGFYFGSTEYPLPENDMGGHGNINHFVIPVGPEYYKYFGIAQKIWRQYSAGVYTND